MSELLTIPPLPPARGLGEDGGAASLYPRYEDIAQDGRLQLSSLMPGMGVAVWAALLSKVPAIDTFRLQGILPILRRLVLVGEDRPCSVNVPIRYSGSFRFAKEKGGDRLFANMWLEATAPVARTNEEAPPKDAPQVLVGRVFAEHVLTRPFAPSGTERRVTRLDAPGVPPVPEDEHVYESGEALVESAGAPLVDAGEATFTMLHTDSNQHVNSLVYPRIFEELAVRGLAKAAPESNAHLLLARAIELRWRKPFFAGERARIQLAMTSDGPTTAVGAFLGEGPKPYTAIAMRLS